MHHSHSAFPLRYLAIALAVYSALQLTFLGLAPISGSSEAREAQVIDTIIRDHEWILPLRNGIIPSKPPLFHWLGALASGAAGEVSEFTARLPSHLAALGILLFSSIAGFRIAQFGQTVEGELHAERVALLTPAILTVLYGFHQLSSQAMVDMTFSFFLWGSISSLFITDADLWRRERRLSSSSRVLFWIFMAGAVLARGPVGLALPLFIIVTTACCVGDLRSTLREVARPTFGWLAFIIPLAWYFAAYLKGGESFIARQLLFENVQRFVGGEKINTESWWFYFPSLLRTSAPWGILMVIGVAFYLRRAPSLSYPGGFKRFTVAPTVALIAGAFLFSLSSGKRHSYMLPLQPFIALQCALLFSMFLERHGLPMRERFWRYTRRLESLLSTLLIVALIALGAAHLIDWGQHPLEEIVKFSCSALTMRIAIVTLIALTTATILKRGGTTLPYARVWGLLILLMTFGVSAGNAVKGTLKGWPVMTEHLLLAAGGAEQIVVIKDTFDEYFDPIFYYAHRPLQIASEKEGITRCTGGSVYVARRSWIERNPNLIPGSIRRLTTLRELKRAFGGSTRGEDLEVFQCFGNNEQAPVTGGELRDAVLKS